MSTNNSYSRTILSKLTPEELEEYRQQYHKMSHSRFYKKYWVWRDTCIKFFWPKDTTKSFQTQAYHNKKYSDKFNDDLNKNIEQVKHKFWISYDKIKILLKKYTFSEILSSDNLQNIQDNIYYDKKHL